MEGSQTSLTMHAVLLAMLITLSHWEPLEMSSAQDSSQNCCTELEMLVKAFPETDYDCLMEDCTQWLMDMRTSAAKQNATSCPVSEKVICEKFAEEKTLKVTTMTQRDWLDSRHVTVSNVLRTVNSLGWKKCVIIYDVNFWSTINLLTSALSSSHVNFIIYDATQLKKSSDLRSLWQEVLHSLKLRNFIVMTHLVFAGTLFKEAEKYDRSLGRTSGLRMLTQWVVVTSGSNEEQLARTASYFDNVVAVIESQDTITYNTSTSVDNTLQCVRTDISTLMYVPGNNSNNNNSNNNNSIINTSNPNSSVIDNRNIDGNSYGREFQSSVVMLPNGHLIVNNSVPNIRNGFNTRTLIVGTRQNTPFVIKQRDSSGRDHYFGLCIDLLKELATVLNFTYELVEPPSYESWGHQNASGYWEGLVGQLYREEVDIVVAPLSFSVERSQAMDATYPWSTTNVAVVFRKPDPDSNKWRTYLRPFRVEVLLCLGATLIVVTVLVHLMACIFPENERIAFQDDQKRAHGGKDEDNVKTLKKEDVFPGPSPDDGFWYLFGALLSQGGIRLPMAGSGRMLVAAWWLFSIVMGATYSGNLIAFLTVQLESKPFYTLSELLHQDDFTCGVTAGTNHQKMLQESKNPILRQLGQKILNDAAKDPEVLSADWEVGKSKVMSGGYAHVTDSVVAEALSRENCEVDKIVDYNVVATPFAVYLPSGSDFTPLFNECVMKMVEAGLVTKWKQNWFRDKLHCVKSVVTESPKITVLDVQSLLYLSIIGFVLALIVLALEFVFHRHPKLHTWATKVGHACVDGCDKQNGGDDTVVDRPEVARAASCKEARSDFHEVFVVREGQMDNETRTEFFEFTYTGSGNHFLFETVYSKPEDFGRVSDESNSFHRSEYCTPDVFGRVMSDNQHQFSEFDSNGSRTGQISDDVKIIT